MFSHLYDIWPVNGSIFFQTQGPHGPWTAACMANDLMSKQLSLMNIPAKYAQIILMFQVVNFASLITQLSMPDQQKINART